MTSGDVGPHSAIKRGRRNIYKDATHIYSLLYIPYISLGLYIMIHQDGVKTALYNHLSMVLNLMSNWLLNEQMVFPSQQKPRNNHHLNKNTNNHPSVFRLESTHRAPPTFLVENAPKIWNKWLTLQNFQPVEVELHAKSINCMIIYSRSNLSRKN